ncbi:MAG: HAMP domain-containing histidine kinase [Pseudomonadales bacterium]|nr:HAMP domain-containing histidine kinase [Pseudomonadales bacterium]
MISIFKYLSPRHNYALTEQQATWKILALLRLIACFSVILLFAMAEWLQLHTLQMVVSWPQLMLCAVLAVLFSLIGFLSIKQNITVKIIFTQLLLDTGLWFLLLQASGGSMNPAISYLLVLLSIAALSLPRLYSGSLLVIMMLLYTFMMNTQTATDHAHMFEWHLWGMWVLFLFNALIMMMVIYLLSRQLREKDQAIANFKEETVRSEQIVMLGTMAANITHDLGTPLSTIEMLVDEDNGQNAQLIKKQISRCKKALGLLKSVDFENEVIKDIAENEYFKQLNQELLLIKPAAEVTILTDEKHKIKSSRLLNQALLALINNAVEAADKKVHLKAFSQAGFYIIKISHDGKSIDEGLLKQLGVQPVESSREGLGIGYYLANASIERLQGRLQIANGEAGVITTVKFKQSDILV